MKQLIHKLDQLKQYHAYFVMAVIFLLTSFIKDMAFFPIACCFVCLGTVSKLKEEGRLAVPEKGKPEKTSTSK